MFIQRTLFTFAPNLKSCIWKLNLPYVTNDENLTRDRYVKGCFTSASWVNIKAWQEVGGFDDSMFIDRVDYDFCMTLWEAGWGIYKTVKTEILHELGSAELNTSGDQHSCL